MAAVKREFWKGLTAVCEMSKFYLLHHQLFVAKTIPESWITRSMTITPPGDLDKSEIYLAVTDREHKFLVTLDPNTEGRIKWGDTVDIWMEEAKYNLTASRNLYNLSRRKFVSKNSLYRARDSGVIPYWLVFALLTAQPTFVTDSGETLDAAYKRIQPMMAHYGAKANPDVSLWS